MENEDLIPQFQAITNETAERSRFYLESSNWDLNIALGSFYDNAGDVAMAADPVPPPTAGQESDSDPEFQDAKPEVMVADGKKVSGEPSNSLYQKRMGNIQRNIWRPKMIAVTRSTRSGKFHSLADYQAEDAAESDEEEGQEYYAGGSEHSGEVILGPGKKKSGEELVTRMFKNARKHGAVPVEAGSSSNQKKGSSFFSGGGYKLGEKSDDHEFIPGAEKAESREDRNLDLVLKLWKNGFTVGDGPLRSYHDEESREFLHAVQNGDIPQELLRLARGGEVNLDMEDHKNEDYKPEKKKMKPFTGEGRTLGGVTPTVVSQQLPSKPPQASSVDPKVNIDESSPVTTVRIQLGDGSRVTQKFNHHHTVAQVYSFVRDQNPGSTRNFVLMTTFPNKELKEDSTTLKEGGLLNAVIVQRFK